MAEDPGHHFFEGDHEVVKTVFVGIEVMGTENRLHRECLQKRSGECCIEFCFPLKDESRTVTIE